MENIKLIVEDCSDCPFYSDDSDYGAVCYHGIEVSRGTLKKEDEIYVRHGAGNCVLSSIPKECPLLNKIYSIELSNIYKQI